MSESSIVKAEGKSTYSFLMILNGDAEVELDCGLELATQILDYQDIITKVRSCIGIIAASTENTIEGPLYLRRRRIQVLTDNQKSRSTFLEHLGTLPR